MKRDIFAALFAVGLWFGAGVMVLYFARDILVWQ